MDRELTPKQQTSEAIRQAEAVLILTGQHPSVDQVAGAIALSAILRKFNKRVTAVISDDIPANARFLPANMIERKLGGLRDFVMKVDLSRAEVDKLKYTIEDGKLNVHITPFTGGFSGQDVSYDYGEYQFDLVIILGVPAYSRIDRIYAQNERLLREIPLVNIDFHRSNEDYGAVNLIETNAASLSEILVALSESLQTGLIDTQIATTLLTGIVAATDRFTATHTTPKALTVAAQMMAMGADQQKVVRGLYRDKSPQPQQRREQPKPQEQPQRPPQIQAVQPRPTTEQQRPAQPAVQQSQPVQPEAPSRQPQADEPSMEELLPPSHIEMSEPEAPQALEQGPELAYEDEQLEPLINAEEPQKPQPNPESSRPKAQNPTNLPNFISTRR